MLSYSRKNPPALLPNGHQRNYELNTHTRSCRLIRLFFHGAFKVPFSPTNHILFRRTCINQKPFWPFVSKMDIKSEIDPTALQFDRMQCTAEKRYK